MALLRAEFFFLGIGRIGFLKNREFYADFKNLNLP
jgi:hypothetical protein